MDNSFHGTVVLLWMLMSMTLGNCTSHKSRAWEVLDFMSAPSIGLSFVPLLSLIASRKNRVARTFWVEPRQDTHWNYVEPIVWRATEEMHYGKYMKFYRMSPEAFDNLVRILTPYLRSECINPIRPQLEIRKIVSIVLYRFAHGYSPDHIADRLKAGGSTTRKYVDIVCNILTDRNKLFGQCISIPTGERLERIISDFKEITGLPNVCGAIDGTHIILADRPNRRVTLAQGDFFNRKKSHSIVLQAVCDANKLFWNVCAGQPRGVHDGGQFKVSNLYKDLRDHQILQEPIVDIRGKMCTPYLIADSAYPIRSYLQKNWRLPNDEEKKRYDSAMNSGRVAIENAFASLKNRWQILRNFNSRVDRAARITVSCCWLHNYCEIWNMPEPGGRAGGYRDPFVGFGNVRLPVIREGERAKAEGESLRVKLYEQWVIENPT